MSALKAVVIVLRCPACGFKRTQSPPQPETCPRCSERLPPTKDQFELARATVRAMIYPAVDHSPPPPEQSCVSEPVDGRVFDER